jgi:hypothetical protein
MSKLHARNETIAVAAIHFRRPEEQPEGFCLILAGDGLIKKRLSRLPDKSGGREKAMKPCKNQS